MLADVRLRCFLLAFLLPAVGLAQGVMTTLAGADWTFPSTPADALKAPIGQISAVAVDPNGNLYIADPDNQLVYRVSKGTLVVVAGNGLAGYSGDGDLAVNASLDSPSGIAVDANGNLYISDTGNAVIRRVTNGIITTVAGSNGRDFSYPKGIALDSAGNLYVADYGNDRVRKVTNGVAVTIAGTGVDGFAGDGGPATSAQFSGPTAVAVDAAGNVFIADQGNSRIRKVSGGVITTAAGDGSSVLQYPTGVAVDSSGTLWISDSYGNRVRTLAAGGSLTTVAGTGALGFSGDGGPAIAATLQAPAGLAVDSAGNLYIADSGNVRVRKVSARIITTVAGSATYHYSDTQLWEPSGIAADSAGNVYLADALNNRIRKLSKGVLTTVAGNGNAGFTGDGGPATSASLSRPRGLALDAAGNLYIADTLNHRIRKVAGGVITTVAGNGSADLRGDGGPAASASLQGPYGVAIDSAGNLYIADTGNSCIRKVSANGTISTIVNGDSLYSPFAVVADAAGNLVIADTGHNRIRKFANNTLTVVAGTGTDTYSGDGGPAANATLNFPSGVAVDAAGNIWIADTANYRIRKVTNGTITTVAGTGEGGYSGDGGAPAAADIYNPFGIAFDASGNLVFADSGNDRIRAVTTAAFSYQVSPAALSLSASAGTAASAQTVALVSPLAGLSFQVTTSAPWLNVSPARGQFPATLQVIADASNLGAGNYSANLTVSVPGATPPSTTVAVSFAVTSATPAALAVDTAGLSFSGSQGGTPSSQQFHVLNSGGGSVSFTATASAPWLTLSTASGTATQSSPATLAVTATPGTLAPGTYSAAITVTGSGTTVNIPVTLSISSAASILLISQSAVRFTAVSQGSSPLPQTFGILNSGQGSMDWSATGSTLSGGNWLSITPASGTVRQPYLDVSLVSVMVNPAALAPGTYYGRIQITSAAANSPQVVTVILNVLDSSITLGPQIFPTGLVFTGTAGVSPGSQDVLIGNPSSAAVGYQSGLIGSAFRFLPGTATIAPGQPATLRVYPDFSKLSPGAAQQGTITLQFSDRSPSQTVNILMITAPAISPVTETAVGCSSTVLQVQHRSLQPGFTAIAGQPTSVEVQVSDACGNPVTPAANAQVTGFVTSGDATIPLTHVGQGVWQGTWRPVHTGSTVLKVTAFAVAGANLASGISAALSGSVNSSTTPIVTAQGVVHAASGRGGLPVAPGSLITIYGLNLSDAAGQSPGVPLPQTLNGTQVRIGDQLLPILYTNSGQLNVQVPFGLPVNTQIQLRVQRDSTESVPQNLPVASATPGIFTINQQGTGQGAIVRSDQVTLAQPGTPAAIGELIVIYSTGLGSVTPAVAVGAPAPASTLAVTDNPVSLTIGGVQAQVLFSGLTPGFAGLYQVNAIVPGGVTPGDAVAVVLSVAGQKSPDGAVTMAVR